MQVWPYFWYGLALGLFVLLAGLAGSIVAALLIRTNTGIESIVSEILVGSVMMYVFYRMALVLPAISLNKKMRFSVAFEKTRGYSTSIIGLAFVSVLFNTGVTKLIASLFDVPQNIEAESFEDLVVLLAEHSDSLGLFLVLSGLVQWFNFMLNISILMTLYGHIAENRQLN